MSTTLKKQTGFTIVELLIVIVVIAILAAISVVAYTGIQNRASDSAVQSDINNFAKKVMLYHAEQGTFPTGNDASAPTGIGNFSLSRSSYLANDVDNNFYYCTGTASGGPAFGIAAISKSGNRYYYSSIHGNVQVYSGAWGTSANICPGMLPGVTGSSFSYGYHRVNKWYNWTN